MKLNPGLPARFLCLLFPLLTFVPQPITADDDLTYETLLDHIGPAEEVALTIYFVGFPNNTHAQLKGGVLDQLADTTIFDAKPWWIPNIPKYGAADFATSPAPPGLPPGVVPPDGLIRHEPTSLDVSFGPNFELLVNANRELPELVEDWQHNNDVINNVNHEGALVNVPWIADPVKVKFLPASKLNQLYDRLEGDPQTFSSANPPALYTLYSYNELFDWLEDTNSIKESRGGATLVFLNLEDYAGQDYAFYGDPQGDVVPAVGNGPVEFQYKPVVASTPAEQAAANLFTGALGGGLTQAKMLASLDVRCDFTITNADLPTGQQIPGALPTQSLCAQWSLVPINNLLGNDGRRYFASDSTAHVAAFEGGGSVEALVGEVVDDLRELYRFGVLQQTVKANHVYSEAYDLRTLVVDLRYSALEACLLLNGAEVDPLAALAACQSPPPVFSEQTYDFDEVFDVGLAAESLAQFTPGVWNVSLVPFFTPGQNPVETALTKAFLRDFLSNPVVPGDPNDPNDDIEIDYPPFYKDMEIIDDSGQLVAISSSWEKGIDSAFALSLFVDDPTGLGIYDAVWPDALTIGEPPYHQTGRASVKPLVFFLTPEPDGPLQEKWGTFPVSFQFTAATLNNFTAFGGGGFWASVAGNEEAGGLLRRDYLQVLPQYALGPNRGNGEAAIFGVLPDGSVLPVAANAFTKKRLELGAPHWCNEFRSTDAQQQEACRDFVRTTTTLQAIETLQHGIGYVHAPEPRTRFHYDGQRSSIARALELLANPNDLVGQALHQMVNMYTTLGESTVWGQTTSDWNGVGPHSGMQAALFRSHAREEIFAVEDNLAYAIDKFESQYDDQDEDLEDAIEKKLERAVNIHRRAIKAYDRWDYEKAISLAEKALSKLDRALTLMGDPDRIYDPLAIPLSSMTMMPMSLSREQIESAFRAVSPEEYRAIMSRMSTH